MSFVNKGDNVKCLPDYQQCSQSLDAESKTELGCLISTDNGIKNCAVVRKSIYTIVKMKLDPSAIFKPEIIDKTLCSAECITQVA